jgi:hypothetical protein
MQFIFISTGLCHSATVHSTWNTIIQSNTPFCLNLYMTIHNKLACCHNLYSSIHSNHNNTQFTLMSPQFMHCNTQLTSMSPQFVHGYTHFTFRCHNQYTTIHNWLKWAISAIFFFDREARGKLSGRLLWESILSTSYLGPIKMVKLDLIITSYSVNDYSSFYRSLSTMMPTAF